MKASAQLALELPGQQNLSAQTLFLKRAPGHAYLLETAAAMLILLGQVGLPSWRRVEGRWGSCWTELLQLLADTASPHTVATSYIHAQGEHPVGLGWADAEAVGTLSKGNYFWIIFFLIEIVTSYNYFFRLLRLLLCLWTVMGTLTVLLPCNYFVLNHVVESKRQ